jgi:AcrR family transcriptional regulator
VAIGTRSARAEATRRRILDAAGPLFVRLGYRETTMSGLAKAAGVAVQTLYLSFGSKAAVLEAVLDADAEDHPTGWSGDLGPDGPTALLRYVDASAAEVARRHPLDAVLRGAAADPDPAELLARARRAALAGHARAVDELAERPGFTGHMSLLRVTESMAALLSPETYGLLVVAHGWTVPDWAEWAGRHLMADLFPAAVSGSPGTLYP